MVLVSYLESAIQGINWSLEGDQKGTPLFLRQTYLNLVHFCFGGLGSECSWIKPSNDQPYRKYHLLYGYWKI